MKNYRAVVVVVSTKGSQGEREDGVGPVLTPRLAAAGFTVEPTMIVTDDRTVIAETLVELADRQGLDLILTSGGTGLSPADLTPEATLDVAERRIPGLAEAMRAVGRTLTPYADLSRAEAAQRRRSLIINLPGSPRGALENLETVLPALGHALDKIQGDPADCARP
jgi:molybdenum cofactor synthesis domain-containing protein